MSTPVEYFQMAFCKTVIYTILNVNVVLIYVAQFWNTPQTCQVP